MREIEINIFYHRLFLMEFFFFSLSAHRYRILKFILELCHLCFFYYFHSLFFKWYISLKEQRMKIIKEAKMTKFQDEFQDAIAMSRKRKEEEFHKKQTMVEDIYFYLPHSTFFCRILFCWFITILTSIYLINCLLYIST